MSETRFTKAPWRVNGDWMIVDSTDRLIAQFEPLNDELSNGSTKESFANAALIAAAPEMYEMLDSIRQCLEWGYSHDEIAGQLLDYTNGLKVLLSKARGEQ